jgi:hypothetical protein
MKKLLTIIGLILPSYLILATPAFAVSSEVTQYTSNTLGMITLIAAAAAVFFLVKGGYQYITSTGKPDSLESAKKTIRNAIIGLVIVLGASLFVSVLSNSFNQIGQSTNTGAVSISQIQSVQPSDGLTQVLIDAVSGFMQNIVQSATKPIVDGIIGYLTSTPELLSNSVIFNFWTIILGITDSLFVLVVALLGLHFMSAGALGFEEIELRHLLPRIGIAFLCANVSLFLANYVIITANTLTKAILDSTGGLTNAWVVNAINPSTFASGNTPLITLVFLVIFLVVSIVLLLLYISRLIMISLGAVLAPFIFLLWAIPKTSDFAEISIKTYTVTVFIVFVHVVIIQLASSFLALPANSGNSLISIGVAIGLFFTLLKTPSLMMQLVMYTSGNAAVKKVGGEIVNVIMGDKGSSASGSAASEGAKLARRRVAA